MNRIELLGRTVEYKEFTNSAKLVVAVKREYKNANNEYDTDFIDCFVFGKTMEYLKSNYEKGILVLVVGSIRKNKREVDGKTTYELQVVAERLNLFGKGESKKDSSFNNDDLPF